MHKDIRMARKKYERQGTPCHAEPGQRRDTADYQRPLRVQESPGGQKPLDRRRACGEGSAANLPVVDQRPGAYSNRQETAL